MKKDMIGKKQKIDKIGVAVFFKFTVVYRCDDGGIVSKLFKQKSNSVAHVVSALR